jgi:HAD superfamily hydrolase (TIGR01509 family)
MAASGPRAAGVEAVIFDLDGVLIDSEGIWASARRQVAERAGRRWPPGADEALMGMSSPEWVTYMRDVVGVDEQPAAIIGEVVDAVLTNYRDRLPLLPGARDAVRRLASRWPLGLASSSNRPVIDAVLSASGLGSCFSVTVSSEEVARGKPSPDVYLAAAAGLMLDPALCVAVEDSANGIRSAAGAGMPVVALVGRGSMPDPAALTLAHVRIENLTSLTVELVASLGYRCVG